MIQKLTDEKRVKIKELWALGYTGAQIAKEVELTRNSVIGFVYRMRKSDGIKKKRPPGPKPTKQKIVKVKKEKKVKAPVKEKTEKPVEIKEDVSATLLDLRFDSCRYIVKDGDIYSTKYCNRPITRVSYCEDHYKICYVPTRYSANNA